MSEQDPSSVRNAGFIAAAAFVTYCAINTGLPPSTGQQVKVDACANELNESAKHVRVLPKACEPFINLGDDKREYDLQPRAQFRDEESPGIAYDAKWIGVYLFGGGVVGYGVRKVGRALISGNDGNAAALPKHEDSAAYFGMTPKNPRTRIRRRNGNAIHVAISKTGLHDDLDKYELRERYLAIRACIDRQSFEDEA